MVLWSLLQKSPGVIPAQAGIQKGCLATRLRVGDGSELKTYLSGTLLIPVYIRILHFCGSGFLAASNTPIAARKPLPHGLMSQEGFRKRYNSTFPSMAARGHNRNW